MGQLNIQVQQLKMKSNTPLTIRLKKAIKLLHALVLAINKAKCRQDKKELAT